jgi:hypothetical protein
MWAIRIAQDSREIADARNRQRRSLRSIANGHVIRDIVSAHELLVY